MDNLLPVLLLGCILFTGFILVQDDKKREEAPCEQFKTYSIKNLPARCMNYFGASATSTLAND